MARRKAVSKVDGSTSLLGIETLPAAPPPSPTPSGQQPYVILKIDGWDDLPDAQRLQIMKWHVERRPHTYMSKELLEQGYKIHHTTLFRWCATRLHGLCSDDVPIEEPALVVAGLERQAIILSLEKCVESIRNMTVPKCETIRDLELITMSISRLVSCNAQRDRVQLEATKAIDKVKDFFKLEVQRMLSAHPELVEKLHAVIDEAAEKQIVN